MFRGKTEFFFYLTQWPDWLKQQGCFLPCCLPIRGRLTAYILVLYYFEVNTSTSMTDNQLSSPLFGID